MIFLAGDVLTAFNQHRALPQNVHGIYLEDNVVVTYDLTPAVGKDHPLRATAPRATAPGYTVRAPRIYYDLTTSKAAGAGRRDVHVGRALADPRSTCEPRSCGRNPADNWTTGNAVVTTSDFAQPHVSIAAREVTVHQEHDPTLPGGVIQTFVAHDVTFDVGAQPVLFWPTLSGDTKVSPLRSIEAGYSRHEGGVVRTNWDVFPLAGEPKPQGVELNADVDYRGKDGPAVGAHLTYDRPMMFGSLDAYVLAHDTGEADGIGDRNYRRFRGGGPGL